jgi:hypothetical protein
MDDDADFTINEWCRRHKVCRSTYYKMQRENRGPKIIKIGSQTRITRKADEAWSRRMERESGRRPRASSFSFASV